jgi:hypothetical protein
MDTERQLVELVSKARRQGESTPGGSTLAAPGGQTGIPWKKILQHRRQEESRLRRMQQDGRRWREPQPPG